MDEGDSKKLPGGVVPASELGPRKLISTEQRDRFIELARTTDRPSGKAIGDALGIKPATARNLLRHLREEGILPPRGSRPPKREQSQASRSERVRAANLLRETGQALLVQGLAEEDIAAIFPQLSLPTIREILSGRRTTKTTAAAEPRARSSPPDRGREEINKLRARIQEPPPQPTPVYDFVRSLLTTDRIEGLMPYEVFMLNKIITELERGTSPKSTTVDQILSLLKIDINNQDGQKLHQLVREGRRVKIRQRRSQPSAVATANLSEGESIEEVEAALRAAEEAAEKGELKRPTLNPDLVEITARNIFARKTRTGKTMTQDELAIAVVRELNRENPRSATHDPNRPTATMSRILAILTPMGWFSRLERPIETTTIDDYEEET